MSKRLKIQELDSVKKPINFSRNSRRQDNLFEESIRSAAQQQQQQSMITTQIHRVIVTSTLSRLFTIVQSPFKYSFTLMKNILLINSSSTRLHHKLALMARILGNKTNFQKQKFFTKMRDLMHRVRRDVGRGLRIMEIVLGKKVVSGKVWAFLKIRQFAEQNAIRQNDHSPSKDQRSIEDKINDYLIEIVQVYMTITVKNLQLYKFSLLHDSFSTLKLYSSHKRAQQRKVEQEESYLKKVQSVMIIQDFLNKKQIRSKIDAFKGIGEVKKGKEDIEGLRGIVGEQESMANGLCEGQKVDENPENEIYVSAIKSMVSLCVTTYFRSQASQNVPENPLQNSSNNVKNNHSKRFFISLIKKHLSQKDHPSTQQLTQHQITKRKGTSLKFCKGKWQFFQFYNVGHASGGFRGVMMREQGQPQIRRFMLKSGDQ